VISGLLYFCLYYLIELTCESRVGLAVLRLPLLISFGNAALCALYFEVVESGGHCCSQEIQKVIFSKDTLNPLI